MATVSIPLKPQLQIVSDNSAQATMPEFEREITLLNQMFDAARFGRMSQESRWIKNYEYYKGIDSEWNAFAEANKSSKVFIPRPYMVVETKVPRIVNAIMGGNEIWKINPHHYDDEIAARIWQKALTQQFNNMPSPKTTLYLWVKDAAIYGNGILKSGWCYKTETGAYLTPQQVLDPVTQSVVIQNKIEMQTVVTHDAPHFTHVDLSEFYPDPNAVDIESCNYIIHRYLVPFNELLRLQNLGIYANIEKIARGLSGMNQTIAGQPINRFSTLMPNHNNSNHGQLKQAGYDLVEIRECWWYDFAKNQKFKTVVANGTTIIQHIPFPYYHMKFPFHMIKNLPMPREFWSWGEIDPIKDLVRDKNKLHNIRADHTEIFSKGIYVANQNNIVDPDTFEDLPPGGVLWVKGSTREAVEVVRPPEFGSWAINQEQSLDLDMQMTTGVNDIAIGAPTRSQVRTATAGMQMAQATNNRYGMSAVLIAEQLREMGRVLLGLNQQFLSGPIVVRMLGESGFQQEFYEARPQDIPRQFDLEVSLAGIDGVSPVDGQMAVQMFSLMANIPGANLAEFVKDILRKNGYEDVERYFPALGNPTVLPAQQLLAQMNIPQVSSRYMEIAGGMQSGALPPVNEGGNNNVYS